MQGCVEITEVDALNGNKRVNGDLVLNGEWSRQIERLMHRLLSCRRREKKQKWSGMGEWKTKGFLLKNYK